MHQLLFILILGAAYCSAAEDDDSFSIGLGVLSPSYKQTVGKEKVKVSFDQKENGQFSYSIGDPNTGYNSYLSFGGAAANSAGNQAASPAAYSSPAVQSSPVPVAPAGYSAPAAPSYSAPAAPAVGYQPNNFVNAPNYGSPSGYNAPSPVAEYQGSQGQAYNSYPLSSGASLYGSGTGPARQPADSSMIIPAGFSYHATEGQAFLRNQAERRQPAAGNILPAGFSYHATEGQSFLRNDGLPNFMVADEKRSAGLGPAEQSFYQNAGSLSQQGGRGLVNGLVGYGPGGPSRRNIPIGAYAGPQGTFSEHGGHQ